MEFELGFQTATNSAITCQGMDVLVDGSIQSGIVMHTEYEITIEEELFTKNSGAVTNGERKFPGQRDSNPGDPYLGNMNNGAFVGRERKLKVLFVPKE